MLNKTVPIFTFVLGVLITVAIAFSWKSCKSEKTEVINKDYYLLNNQISKLNKMVVLEQDFSSFQTHKSAAFSIAGYDVMPKEMVLYTTAKAQVSYDLSKMKIKVDSANKKLIIEELPRAEIKVFPEVKIHFMNDYALNRFDKKNLNSIMESAKANMVKNVDKKDLEKKGRKQLFENLNDIFVLAKALDYTIEDDTGILQKIQTESL
ncbi:DUF4230 domain-containing protein [Elizabethkingia sp. JS20170427COW]|uniref:DUF4230 domain-containing protein n=1 Tax=Elizabethkingia sp. JS20170427COW TaxID=2583851 RepID=UPI0011108C2F|nr:DUF4230 domain-containing protein [Elizabethkingia sp. JS20170427COW]QCX53963.1 DUF4230 domain-containing protein [Elizabethkingia sp. JS20170427COW]